MSGDAPPGPAFADHAGDGYVSVTVLRRGWFDLLITRIRLNGREEDRILVDHPSGAAVLLYDPGRRVALVTRQTRDGPLWVGAAGFLEAVAGVSDGDEDPRETARREAAEEVGVMPPEVEWVGRVWMTPSSTTERVHLFLGAYREADRVSAGGGAADENERISAIEVALTELWDRVVGAPIADAKLLMLLQALRLRRADLFD